jgi:hypothetical protein
MFRCQSCQALVPPGTPPQRLVVKSRKKDYKYRSCANTFRRTTETGKRKVYHTDDPDGTGEEIVKELIVCQGCAARNGHG